MNHIILTSTKGTMIMELISYFDFDGESHHFDFNQMYHDIDNRVNGLTFSSFNDHNEVS